MSIHLPDPVELSESRIDRLEAMYIDEHTCMLCHKRVDYELICMSPMGDGPAVCEECAGIKP
jgi:hypothetical protein